MTETIYVIRTAEYFSVEDALEDGAAYAFEIFFDPESDQLVNIIDCIDTVSRCINADSSKVQGFIRVAGKYIELNDYYLELRN